MSRVNIVTQEKIITLKAANKSLKICIVDVRGNNLTNGNDILSSA